MSTGIIAKSAEAVARANLRDYASVRGSFSWAREREALLEPDGTLNIGRLAADRHVAAGRGERVAVRCLSATGAHYDMTYGALAAAANRFGNVLRSLGVEPGNRVFALLGRVPELYPVAVGTLKCGAVFSPLFSVFGPEPIQTRLAAGQASVLVTTPQLYQRKVAQIRERVPSLKHVLLVGETTDGDGVASLSDLMARASTNLDGAPTMPDDLALLHFTSGTTGKPKGAMHVHDAVVAHAATARYALDFQPDDVFWCTADPGWVTGTSYGIIAPLVHGLTMLVDEGEFDAERWYRVLESEGVTNWYTAPTAVRMLMRSGEELRRPFDLSRLRFVASVGEPLNPEAVRWGERVLGLAIHDNWWQTETGGIMIANYAALPVKPGSMGLPVPGIEAAIVRRVDDRVEVVAEPGEQGELALEPGWPSMFRGYLDEPERYQKCFAGGWYLTGDLATRDEDGYYWFVGRADDVIKSAGHLIGPFEVESALMEHPAVAEAGVIGKPDPIAMEIVKAFVVLKPGFDASEDLRLDLLGFARKRLGAAVAPREIAFSAGLPRTRSGKIMRRLLKARELGLAEGDTSMLEGAS